MISILFLCVLLVAAVVAQDAAEQAMRDVALGLEGLKELQNNPALLAQLMEDMKDPELMAEAQKMMDSPEYKKQMKKMTNSKEFKQAIKKTEEMLSDPHRAAQAEAKMEHLARVGKDQLKKGASNMMEETLQAAMNDPAAYKEMQNMMRDPNFKKQLNEMAQSPEFLRYVDAMQDMLKDPATKKQFEALSEAMMGSA